MGTEPYLVAQATVAIVAQRLVRTVCPRCKKPAAPREEVLRRLGVSPTPGHAFAVGSGCPECRGSGYKGRAGVHELLVVTSPVREALCAKATAFEIERLARQAGFRTLRESALIKAVRGLTTLDEVIRVTSSAPASGGIALAEAA
jgi:type IV pilus assembly protein PilB